MSDEGKHPKITADPETGDWEVAPRPELFGRLEARQPHPEALVQLQVWLAGCTELYEQVGDEGKLGACKALEVVIDYLAGQGLPHVVLEPLTAICIAFSEAAAGKRPPLFKNEIKGQGGRSNRYLEQEQDGLMAAILECHFQDARKRGDNKPLESAAAHAANLISVSMGVQVTAAQLKKKRELATGQEAGAPARVLYECWAARAEASQHPLEYVKQLARSGARPRNPIG